MPQTSRASSTQPDARAAAAASAIPDTAMIFAAGLGTRMRPITDTIPKPLVRVGGRTLIDHMLDRFAAAGVANAVVNVHYRADQIEAQLRGRAAPKVLVSNERALLLDQGGGIKKAMPLLGTGPFFIANTDALWVDGPRDSLRAMGEFWDPMRMDVLLLAARTEGSIGVDWPGDFHLGADGRLTKRAPGESSDFVYAGVGIIKPELFTPFAEDVFRLAPIFFDAAARGRLFGFVLDGLWLHVGTPQAIGEAEAALAAASV